MFPQYSVNANALFLRARARIEMNRPRRASERASAKMRATAKCNWPILTTKAYHVCRPLGPGPTSPHPTPPYPIPPLLSSPLLACDEIFIVPGPGLTGYARSCETVPIYSPTNLSRRGRRGASNKSPQKREKVVGPRRAEARHVAGTSGSGPHEMGPDRRDRSFGPPAPSFDVAYGDARKNGTMQNSRR